MENYYVYDNESLSGTLNFARMDEIRNINIGDTALAIPLGLDGKPNLSSVNCSYSRFPGRSAAPLTDGLGGGNPSNVNNHFFNTKNPNDFGAYVFQNCSNLSSISMYSSRMDGFFPKLVGNNALSSIDLRNTSIEGGRPSASGENYGEHGRRYIMWNDTFEDAQNITEIRIRSGVLGRNIGEYDAATNTYSKAAFQGATFNLPNLTVLEILCPEQRIRGEFLSLIHI